MDNEFQETDLKAWATSQERPDNADSINLYTKYKEILPILEKEMSEKIFFEAFLVKGKKLKKDWKKVARDHRTRTIKVSGLLVAVIDSEDEKDKLTFSRLSACMAYHYYCSEIEPITDISQINNMIVPSLMQGCETLPVNLSPEENKTNLKYNKLFCLGAPGIQFIPKLMENDNKSSDLVGGAFVISMLMDYTQYKKRNPSDKVSFANFLYDTVYMEYLQTFYNAVRNFGIDHFDTYCTQNPKCLAMAEWYIKRECIITADSSTFKNGRRAIEITLKTLGILKPETSTSDSKALKEALKKTMHKGG